VHSTRVVKAPGDWRTPKPRGRLHDSRSVVECGSPLPLFFQHGARPGPGFARCAFHARGQSARGLAHSKTSRRLHDSRSVVECGGPLPLFSQHGARPGPGFARCAFHARGQSARGLVHSKTSRAAWRSDPGLRRGYRAIKPAGEQWRIGVGEFQRGARGNDPPDVSPLQ
jgi:hypothetical protein